MWFPWEATWTIGAIVATGCAILGLLAQGVRGRVARRRESHFIGVGASLIGIAFHCSMLVLLAAALTIDGRSPARAIGRMWTTTHEPVVSSAVAVPVLLGLVALAVLWSRLPWVGKWTASDPGAYSPGGTLTPFGLALVLLVRYPLTVFSEESVFRGYLQVDLRWGIVAGSAAFAAYHLMQWRTIPSLLPYAFAGGVLVAWTGTLWPTALVHYVLDAGFASVIVWPAQRRSRT